MATLPFPTPVDLSGNPWSEPHEQSGSLLFGGDPPALDVQGAGPAPTFAQSALAMAQQTQPVSVMRLTEALVTDSLSLLEARGVLKDAYQTVEMLRSLLESPYEVFREVSRMIFTSLRSLPRASDTIPVPQLASQMRRLLPRVDLASIASPIERHFPLVSMDLNEYVTSPARPTPETPLGTTAADLSSSPEGSVATTFHGFDAQGRAVPHVAMPGGAQVPMPPVQPSQMQVPEPRATYARLAELQAILGDYQRRIQGKRGQDIHITAASTLVSLVSKVMSESATSDMLPRTTVVAFRLAHRVALQPVQGFLDGLMLGMVAQFATERKAEEMAYTLLRPLNTLVLIRIWQAAQRVQGEDSAVFTTLIRPQLQAELIRAALVASDAREVSLRPSALRTILTAWILKNPLVRQAVFGSEQVYERWTMVAQAMEQAEKRHTPLFTALSLQAPIQRERTGEVQCAPVTLACFMSDPVTARALAGALQRPRTLGESGIAQRLRAESIEEMQHEQVTSQW